MTVSRAKKPKQKTYTITEKQLTRLKEDITKSATKLATKMAILLTLCSVSDVLHPDEEKFVELIETIDRYSGYVDETKTIRMRDLAESIFNSTGVDFRSW